jgi:hypothetical protein
MGKAIPAQHPAVVLRSHYRQLRALLAIAMIAVVGLTAAVVILAGDGDEVTGTSSARPIESINYGGFNPATGRPDSAPLPQRQAQAPSATTRYDGGPEEGSRAVVPAQPPNTRYDGGPEEGTAALTQRSAPATFDPTSIKSPPSARYDGGPDEGTRGALSSDASSNAVPGTRYDGGPEEGSRGSGH